MCSCKFRDLIFHHSPRMAMQLGHRGRVLMTMMSGCCYRCQFIFEFTLLDWYFVTFILVCFSLFKLCSVVRFYFIFHVYDFDVLDHCRIFTLKMLEVSSTIRTEGNFVTRDIIRHVSHQISVESLTHTREESGLY